MAVHKPNLKYLEYQLISILEQSIRPNQIIIVVDGNFSENLRINILKILKDCSIENIIVKNKNEQGYSSAFRYGLKFVKSDIVYFSDQDDIWNRNKIEVTSKYLKTGSCDAVINNCQFYWDKGQKFGPTKAKIIKNYFGSLNPFIAGCCTAITRRVSDLMIEGLFDYLEYDEQAHLIANLVSRRKIVLENLQLYRRHNANSSLNDINSGLLQTKPFFDVLQKYLLSWKVSTLLWSKKNEKYKIFKTYLRVGKLTKVHFGPFEGKLLRGWILAITSYYTQSSIGSVLRIIFFKYLYSSLRYISPSSRDYLKIPNKLNKNFIVSRLNLDLFHRWGVGVFSIIKRGNNAQTIYDDLERLVIFSAEQNKSLLLLRLSDGEFKLLLGLPLLAKGISLKSRLGVLFRLIKYFFTNNFEISNTNYSGNSKLSLKSLKKIRNKSWLNIKNYSNDIIFCAHLSWSNKSKNQIPYINKFLSTFITLNPSELDKKLFPFYFVYAMISSGKIFYRKKVLVISSFFDNKADRVSKSLVKKGVLEVKHHRISSDLTYNVSLDISSINKFNPDIVLFGAGVFKLVLIPQLVTIQAPVLDAGYMLEVLSSKGLSLSRPYCH